MIPDEERFDPIYDDADDLDKNGLTADSECIRRLKAARSRRPIDKDALLRLYMKYPTEVERAAVIRTLGTTTGRFEVDHPSYELVKRGSTDMDKVTEDLQAALLKFADVQSLLGRFGGKQPPRGSVLRWVKTFDRGSGELKLQRAPWDNEQDITFEVSAPTEYVYVAFRAPDDVWYVTGMRGRGAFDWNELLKQIGDSPCQVVSKWETVPVPEKPSEESLDPESWARLMFGPKTVEQNADPA
jgi:hypothetical protein